MKFIVHEIQEAINRRFIVLTVGNRIIRSPFLWRQFIRISDDHNYELEYELNGKRFTKEMYLAKENRESYEAFKEYAIKELSRDILLRTKAFDLDSQLYGDGFRQVVAAIALELFYYHHDSRNIVNISPFLIRNNRDGHFFSICSSAVAHFDNGVYTLEYCGSRIYAIIPDNEKAVINVAFANTSLTSFRLKDTVNLELDVRKYLTNYVFDSINIPVITS